MWKRRDCRGDLLTFHAQIDTCCRKRAHVELWHALLTCHGGATSECVQAAVATSKKNRRTQTPLAVPATVRTRILPSEPRKTNFVSCPAGVLTSSHPIKQFPLSGGGLDCWTGSILPASAVNSSRLQNPAEHAIAALEIHPEMVCCSVSSPNCLHGVTSLGPFWSMPYSTARPHQKPHG